MTRIASKYPKLFKVNKELEDQNDAIQKKQNSFFCKEERTVTGEGMEFKGRKKKELQKETGKEPIAHGIRAKLAEKKQEIQNEQKNKQHTHSQNKD